MTDAFSIYNKAEGLVEIFGTRNPEKIVKFSGIEIFYNEFEKLLGMYTCLFERRIIILNSLLSAEMNRMVLTHELGHDVLHREGAVSTNGVADFKEFSMTCKSGTLEYEANAFCAHLLIPNEDFFDSIKEGYNVDAMASAFGVDPNIILIKGRELQKMGYKLKNCNGYNSCFLKNLLPT